MTYWPCKHPPFSPLQTTQLPVPVELSVRMYPGMQPRQVSAFRLKAPSFPVHAVHWRSPVAAHCDVILDVWGQSLQVLHTLLGWSAYLPAPHKVHVSRLAPVTIFPAGQSSHVLS